MRVLLSAYNISDLRSSHAQQHVIKIRLPMEEKRVAAGTVQLRWRLHCRPI